MLFGCVAAQHRERVGAKDLHLHTAYRTWRPDDTADVHGANVYSVDRLLSKFLSHGSFDDRSLSPACASRTCALRSG
jgi:hypothetical protein